MDITKKPYEISLWEDQLFWHRRKLVKADVTEDSYVPGKYYSLHTGNFEQSVIPYVLNNKAYDANTEYYQLADMWSGNYIEGNSVEDIYVGSATSPGWFEDGKLVPQTVISFYKENRLCTIGSDTMTSLARCVNPKLTRKVNGEQILQFTMYYQYVDFETGKKVYNPFNKYMVNERKIKLRLGKPGSGAKWFDFVIKQIQEDSESKAFTYTCKSQFVNELSKSGFDLVLDNELENNMGTVDQLATTILEGSDWSVRKGDNLKQFIEEPLYRLKTFVDLSAKNMETEASITIPAGSYIYAFYSHVNDKVSDLQFLYSSDDVFERDDKLVIDKVKYPNYITSGVAYTDSDWPDFTKNPDNNNYEASLSMDYRGMRLVRQIQTKYDSTIDKYVQVYKKKDTDDIYYGFTETDYISPTAVVNYVANPSGFITTTGWQTTRNAKLEVVTSPEVTAETFDSEFTSYLCYDDSKAPQLFNHSVQGFRSSIKGFQVGEEYVVRLKYKHTLSGEYLSTPLEYLYLAKYELENDKYEVKQKIFTFCENLEVPDGVEHTFKDGYAQFIAKCENSVSEKEFKNILNKYGLIFGTFNWSPIYIEDVQLFPCIRRSDGSIVLPGDEIFSEIKTTYKYYKPNPEWESIEDLILSDHGEEPNSNYIVQYNDGADAFTKVRSITAKESNRFNLLQDLNETFECWAQFEILHDQDTGEILLGKDVGKLDGDEAYRQQKFVTFKEYVGKRNYAGFRYGVNSKSIKRTIDSESIVSKLIVKDNVNEFAPNGFCSIARASDNPTRENFLINFDHYIQQRLLNLATVTNDLYLDVNGYIGYYKQLKRLNANREEKIDLQANLVVDISKYSAAHQTYKVSYDAAVDERLSIEGQIVSYIDPENRPFASVIANKELTDPYKEDKTYNNLLTKWSRCKTIERQHEPLYRTAEINLKKAEEQYENIAKELEILTKEKRALNLQFYKKYSRFIQEGSWNDENYVDDNLYYLDACSTLHTSAQPKVTYDISVLDLSQMPEYSGYDFDLGDITYIEDTEFFGWSLIDGKTPYKEEIIISEIVQELDEPEKNVIKVQNYKTQFEDLFQRITATTQSVEYHEGEYQRAAGIVQPNGMISASVLESSLANNAFVLSNAKDQSIIWDESGITATSINNTSEMVRLVSGGIFLSTDGGQTWRTGITASGINTSLLTAGQINADEINIMSGGQPAFRWDSKGLSAYYKENGSYNLNKYVRFDQYGLYGINNKVVEINSLKDVHDNAHFALTWDKFLLRSAYGTGSITIDSEEHIVIRDDNNIRIKIGNIGDEENPNYGLLIKDDSNNLVMHTDSEGKMWISSALSIGNQETSTVQIGYLEKKKEGTEIHQILRAGDPGSQFIVYEDGTITATAGIIGGIELGNFNTLQRLEVIMQNGDTFTTTGNQANPETLYFSVSLEGFAVNNPATDIKWEGTDSLNNEWLLFGRGKDFVINYKDLYDLNPDLEICYIRASATSNEKDSNGLPKVFSKIFAIKIYSDALKLEILSSNGNIFINKRGTTTLTAKLYSGKDEVDAEELGYEFEWYKSDEPDRVYATGKTLTFDLENSEEIDYMGTYTCQVVQVQGGQNE